MSYSAVIAEIETILKSATGVVDDNVYKYDKLCRTWKELKDAFEDDANDVIHGYSITRNRVESMPEASRVNHVVTTYIIRGWYSLKDDGTSETTFQGFIDNIREKFRADPRLNNSCLTSTPLQVDTIEPRMYSAVLCHYAEMRLGVEEEETFS